MPFEIIRNDITNMEVDVIVNTANPRPIIGAGTDAMIHAKAGPRLLEARRKIGEIGIGEAYITPAFDLKAKYVIHTVGPVWYDGSYGEETKLRRCYENTLQLAAEWGCKSIAFPLISTGNYGFPKDRALKIAISVFTEFLAEHEMRIWLVVFHDQAYRLSEQLFHHVASYIDQHYVDECEKAARRLNVMPRMSRPMSRMLEDERCSDMVCQERTYAPPREAPKKKLSLAELLKQEDAGFSETLAKRIQERGKKKSEVYKKANLTKQHFSKILNNPDYKPTKSTALALAVALELNLEQTRDLIGRAGFALTNSSKFDLIVRYFIETGNYNVVEINIALYEFDQPLLGARDF